MNHQSLWSGRSSGETGAPELYFGVEWWEGAVVNKQEAILISHAAVEELISFMLGSLSLTHTQSDTHTHPLRKLVEIKHPPSGFIVVGGGGGGNAGSTVRQGAGVFHFICTQ